MRKLAIGLAITFALCAQVAVTQPVAPPKVAEVRIEGLERVSEQVARARIEVQPGAEINQRAIARDIRRLYELGFFTNIIADVTTGPEGAILTYQVEEKRVIESVNIVGNKKINERRIRGVLSLREGGPFIPEACDEEREAILDYYETKGFANASVDIIADKVGPSRVRVTYAIEEGPKARIRSVRFEGNEALSQRRLRKLMKTKKAFWFLGGKYEETKLEQDLAKVVDEYGNHGRLEAAIDKTDMVYTDSGKGLNLTVHVNEGAEYHVDTLDLNRNIVFDDDELLDLVDVQAGDVHNKGQVAEDAQALEENYQASGYVDAHVVPQVTLDREDKTTNVVYDLTEGDLKYIKEIIITGNEITKDEIIRRRVVMLPGERYDGQAREAAKRSIENTRYFDEVRLTLQDPLAEDAYFTDLLVDVEEGNTDSFNFGAGYSTEDGVGGFAELQLNNFDITNWPRFSGGGQRLTLKLNVGSRRDQYAIGFTDPEFLGYPISFGFDIFDESYKVRGGADYQEDRRGAQLRLAKALSPYVTLRGTLRYETTDISDLPFFVNADLRRQRGESTTISTRYELERNTINNYRDPSDGAKHSIALEVAGLLGGDNEFVKVEHDSIWYWALSEEEKWIFSFRTREGWMTEFGGSDYTPLQDRFYAGGATTVRGYENRDIGPRAREFYFFGDSFATGGDIRLVSNLEVKYKLTDMVRIYGFADAGGVWEEDDFALGEMKYSVGLGLGVDIPAMGPIRVDYGFPINPDDHQGSGRLHLVSGLRF